MDGTYDSEEKRVKLAASFDVVGRWAAQASPDKFGVNLEDICGATTQLQSLSTRTNPGKAMSQEPELVKQIDNIIALQKAFKALPKSDPDRSNQELRTAIRRIEEVRNKEVWHVQFT